MSENCWFLRGFHIGPLYLGVLRFHSRGQEASVEFDWEKAFNDRLLLGWYHSHPKKSFVYPSQTDHKTARSWVKALGREVLCGIKCELKDTLVEACYRFYEMNGWIYYTELKSFLLGNIFLAIRTNDEKISV